MKDNYKILNCDPNATKEEIDTAYENLRKKYAEDRFLDGEEGNIAAKKLTELEIAYKEILKEREEQAFESHESQDKVQLVYNHLKNGDIVNAQYVLDTFDNRDHEWHYLQSVVFYKKKWYNESKKQLEIAISMKPDEEKYKQDYEKLKNHMFSGNTNGDNVHQGSYEKNTSSQPQMGGNSCMQSCCECLWCNAMLNCCCNSGC